MTIKYNRGSQILAFPITIFGSCFFAWATIAPNNEILVLFTIFGFFIIRMGFVMVWVKENGEEEKTDGN